MILTKCAACAAPLTHDAPRCVRCLTRYRSIYAEALYNDPDAKLDDIREAVTTLEETERTARRVLGSAYPTTGGIERALRAARAALRAREPPSETS